MTNQMNAREIVLNMLIEVTQKQKYSHTILNSTLKTHQQLEKQDRAFISRLFTGTVKEYIKLDYVINQYSSVPTDKMKPLIRNLLRLSVYQLLSMEQVPESAVCNEAVKLAKKRSFSKLSGFVNGVLRTIARNKDSISYPDRQKQPEAYLEITYSVPRWLVIEFLRQYDFQTVERMLEASQKEKETTIRCNQKKLTPLQLEALLLNEGVSIERSEYLPYAFTLKDYDYLEKLDSFTKGSFAVQDISSMLVCEIAGIKNDDTVIDVCAAPGGKALHAAEKAKRVIARDLTDHKVRLINDNMTRMGFTNVVTEVWDAAKLDSTMTEQADVVVCDLPCSGLGVFGKKADLKYRIEPLQLKELVVLQRNILETVQNYVKPGGCLIFSTCTVNQEENIENRNWFLEHFNFKPESLDLNLPKQLKSDTTTEGYLQLIQGVHNTDGFFISKFRKL